MTHIKLTALLLLAFYLGACATIPPSERDSFRDEIDSVAEELVNKLIDSDPEFQKHFEASAGYFAGSASTAKVPVLGGANGIGVLVNKENGHRVYMNLQRFDIGAGLGAGRVQFAILVNDKRTFDLLRSGLWSPSIGIESHSGDTDRSTITNRDGLKVFVIQESGAAIVATARLSRVSVNTDLTDMGISAIGVPNTGFQTEGRQTNGAPRIWEQKLPFLAQKVLDEGYDLPLAYGAGLTYANVDQEMILTDLSVGFNGSEKEPFEFVDFQNARAKSETVQVKLDAWLFPFMNVFAMVGRLDGEAPIDVVLDGNGMLDQLGESCNFPPSPLCALLSDRVITLPITAPFTGTTYGLGTVLAGGWKSWFVSLPFNVTYADMDTTNTKGAALTFTPRVGRLFMLGNAGNLAMFIGGNYLDADLEVDGSINVPVPGDQPLSIDYTIDQKNSDEWNLLFGGNWDITKHWSISAEYNGFIGSRDAFISSLTYRY